MFLAKLLSRPRFSPVLFIEKLCNNLGDPSILKWSRLTPGSALRGQSWQGLGYLMWCQRSNPGQKPARQSTSLYYLSGLQASLARDAVSLMNRMGGSLVCKFFDLTALNLDSGFCHSEYHMSWSFSFGSISIGTFRTLGSGCLYS